MQASVPEVMDISREPRQTLEGYGASLLFSTNLSTAGGSLPLVGAVLGSWDHAMLANDVHALLESVQDNYHQVELVKKYHVYGTYTTPWGDTAQVIAGEGEQVTVWGDQPIRLELSVDDVTTTSDGDEVGRAAFTTGDATITVPLVVNGEIEDPWFWWRVGHPGLIWGDW